MSKRNMQPIKPTKRKKYIYLYDRLEIKTKVLTKFNMISD